MKTHNGMILWAVASILGGCAPMDPAPVAGDVHRVPVGGANASSSRLILNGASLPNGILVQNGAALPYGVVIASEGTRVLALTNLASRPLGRSGAPAWNGSIDP